MRIRDAVSTAAKPASFSELRRDTATQLVCAALVLAIATLAGRILLIW